jgi:hypothetical protein
MVFAVAALILHFAPGALSTSAAASTAAITGGAEATTSSNAAAPSTHAPISRETDASSTTHFNFDKVSLTVGSKESSTPKLSAISLESSTADAHTLSNIRVTEIQPGKPQEIAMAERRRYTKSWLVLSAAQHGAATFDAYSTRQAVSRGAIEDDPLMRPFAHSAAIYAAIQAGPVALDMIARRMQHSEVGFVRRIWWVPQSVSTGMFIFSGVHNLNVAAHQ